MSKKNGFLILLAAILIALTTSLFITIDLEAKIYGSISGKVLGEDTGKGIKGVIVRLVKTDEYGQHNVVRKKCITDKEGKFLFTRVRASIYFLEYQAIDPYVSHPEEEDYTKQADEIINLGEGENKYVQKILKVGAGVEIKVNIEGEDVSQFGGGDFYELLRLEGDKAIEIRGLRTSSPEIGMYKITGISEGRYVLVIDEGKRGDDRHEYPYRFGAMVKEFELSQREQKQIELEFSINDPKLEIEPVDGDGRKFDKGSISIYGIKIINGAVRGVPVYRRFYDYREDSYFHDPIRPIILKPGTYIIRAFGYFSENLDESWGMDPAEISISQGEEIKTLRLILEKGKTGEIKKYIILFSGSMHSGN